MFLALIAVFGCSTEEKIEDGIVLSGTVGFPGQGLIKLEKFIGNSPTVIDTVELNDDYTFNHVLEIETPGYYRLNFYDKQQVVMILDDDDVNVNVDGNARNGFSEIRGSYDHDLIKDIQEIQRQLQTNPEIQEINNEFSTANSQGDEVKMEQLRDKYLEMLRENNEQIAEYLENAEPSLATIEILRSGNVLNPDDHFELYLSTSEKLMEAYPNNQHAIDFSEMVEKMKTLAIGSEAPEIELPNPEGELVKLSSLRGNYVLVDFWAKWCKPCRMENPNVVRMYKKYNPKGFEVFGVSLDRNKRDWVQAIDEDGLTWTHVSDLKYFNSEAAKLYNVDAIPFAVLLDPDGVIIGKNLRGKALENKLAEIFD